jgi:hypothetical protein
MDVPEPVAAATARLFQALSAARGKRAFHPEGVVHEAVFAPWARSSPSGVELLDGGERPLLVRLSRALGLPDRVPDILGFAMRFTDAYGPGRHQDILCVTSWDAPPLHHALVPATGLTTRPYSSLLPFEVAGDVRLFGVLPRSAETFDLALSPLTGRFEGVGTIRLGATLPPERGERLRFNPWNTGGGIRPTGPLMGLRDPAYRGSQRGAAT